MDLIINKKRLERPKVAHLRYKQSDLFWAAQDIHRTNVLTMKNAPPPGGHVFQPTGTIFELIQDIIETNLLTKFNGDQTINVASRVLTWKNAPPPGPFFFLHFPIYRTINMASRMLTRQMLTPHNTRRTKGVNKSSP
ncbi:hypothetical protein DPMN_062619 [Dreissena polymorpha]|uniref:Uncharacterized protein n=1 Tax=Dreissena polymorpha TaxID=45954 RepID=A0A9D4HJI1_DREPO|nr:hypothetical protein DPMN_062619 [Dreissena polymorpha]